MFLAKRLMWLYMVTQSFGWRTLTHLPLYFLYAAKITMPSPTVWPCRRGEVYGRVRLDAVGDGVATVHAESGRNAAEWERGLEEGLAQAPAVLVVVVGGTVAVLVVEGLRGPVLVDELRRQQAPVAGRPPRSLR